MSRSWHAKCPFKLLFDNSSLCNNGKIGDALYATVDQKLRAYSIGTIDPTYV